MKNKIVLITGASSGIGKATALALAKQGATLVLVSRNEERGNLAGQEIKQIYPQASLEYIPCDLSSLEKVRQLAAYVNHKYTHLDVLINNAGIWPGKRENTADGFELSWATNHLGPFLLTNLLMDALQKADKGRIINVSSEAHRLGQIEFNPAMARRNYNAFTAYCDSKLANILFTYELARRLENTSVTANALHPGIIASNLGNTGRGAVKWLFQAVRPFLKTPEQGAATTVYLAAASEAASKNGLYFKNRRPVKSSKLSYNQALARRLWKISAEQTGLENSGS